MTRHFLKRNDLNEPVCACGYRPAILDEPAPVGKQWKARTAVLDHVKALTADVTPNQRPVTRFADDALGLELKPRQEDVLERPLAQYRVCAPPAVPRSPEAPFRGGEGVKYPRAGVRQTSDGRWLLTLWDGDEIVHVIDQEDRIHDDPYTAIAQGWLTVGACRRSGTNLSSRAAVPLGLTRS